MRFYLEVVWSNNRCLPKANIIKRKSDNNKYYQCLPDNKFNNYTYRLKPKLLFS